MQLLSRIKFAFNVKTGSTVRLHFIINEFIGIGNALNLRRFYNFGVYGNSS